MTRRLLNLLTLLSLLLCSTAAALWLWGGLRPVTGWRYLGLLDADVEVESSRGVLRVTTTLWNRPQFLPVTTDPPGALPAPGRTVSISLASPDGAIHTTASALHFGPVFRWRRGGVAWEEFYSTHPPGAQRREAAGLRRPPPVLVQWHRMVVPLAYLVALFAVLPTADGWRRLRQRRRRLRTHKGLCVVCGYDLRASRDRCPECGATAAERRPR